MGKVRKKQKMDRLKKSEIGNFIIRIEELEKLEIEEQ